MQYYLGHIKLSNFPADLFSQHICSMNCMMQGLATFFNRRDLWPAVKDH